VAEGRRQRENPIGIGGHFNLLLWRKACREREQLFERCRRHSRRTTDEVAAHAAASRVGELEMAGPRALGARALNDSVSSK
jgi:hypothetical protein